MSILEFTKSELARLREPGGEPDSMQDAMDKCIIDMVDLFESQGHSGFSASYAIGILEKLLRWEPITPLTGEADEWNECGTGVFQNKRCSRVFKDKDGRAFDIDGIIFRDKDGMTFTNRNSCVYVEFPYTPNTIIKDTDE